MCDHMNAWPYEIVCFKMLKYTLEINPIRVSVSFSLNRQTKVSETGSVKLLLAYDYFWSQLQKKL